MPAIPVAVQGPKGGGTTIGYLDSGAPSTGIPVVFAEALGIDLEQADGLSLTRAAIRRYKRAKEPVELEVAGRTITVEPLFGEFEHLLIGPTFRALPCHLR